MKKHVIVGVLILLIFFGILALDAYLAVLPDWPTLSQSVIYWTDKTPLVPVLGGLVIGFCICHWWESYFYRNK